MISSLDERGLRIISPAMNFHGKSGDLVAIHPREYKESYDTRQGIILRESIRYVFHWSVLVDSGMEDIHQDALEVIEDRREE